MQNRGWPQGRINVSAHIRPEGNIPGDAVREVLRRYDALALADTAGVLGDDVRNAAGG